MPWYRVRIHGENFFFDVDGVAKRMGFYTVRFVEAGSGLEAKDLATAQIHEDRRLGAQLESEDLATLNVEEVTEVEEASVPEVSSGLTFYEAETDD